MKHTDKLGASFWRRVFRRFVSFQSSEIPPHCAVYASSVNTRTRYYCCTSSPCVRQYAVVNEPAMKHILLFYVCLWWGAISLADMRWVTAQLLQYLLCWRQTSTLRVVMHVCCVGRPAHVLLCFVKAKIVQIVSISCIIGDCFIHGMYQARHLVWLSVPFVCDSWSHDFEKQNRRNCSTRIAVLVQFDNQSNLPTSNSLMR